MKKAALLVCAAMAACGTPSPTAIRSTSYEANVVDSPAELDALHEVAAQQSMASSTTSSTAIPTTVTTSTTSTTVALVVTTVQEAVEAPTTAPRQNPRPTTTTALPAAPSGQSGDFWWWLANCESENGRTSSNQYQFMGGTAEKVGYYPGAPLAAQTAMAQGWARTLRAEGTHPGSRSGWPECWWSAIRNAGYEGG